MNHQVINTFNDDAYIQKYSFLDNIEKYVLNHQTDEIEKDFNQKNCLKF